MPGVIFHFYDKRITQIAEELIEWYKLLLMRFYC